jgi:hypothetical protein
MDSSTRERLKEIAERGLAETYDEEQWSFVNRCSKSYVWCPWEEVQDLEYDGDPSSIEDQLSPERFEQLDEDSSTDLTESELELWRRAQAEQYAKGSDWEWLAWIVPISDQESGAKGLALFITPAYGDPDIPPRLVDVFDSLKKAEKYLLEHGAVQGFSLPRSTARHHTIPTPSATEPLSEPRQQPEPQEGQQPKASSGITIEFEPGDPRPPRREDFPDEESFEEALGYWRSHIGRILAMRTQRRMQKSQDSASSAKPAHSSSPEHEEPHKSDRNHHPGRSSKTRKASRRLRYAALQVRH